MKTLSFVFTIALTFLLFSTTSMAQQLEQPDISQGHIAGVWESYDEAGNKTVIDFSPHNLTTTDCHQVMDRVFDHGVARATQKATSEENALIEQKVWIQAYYTCAQSSSNNNNEVGIEIMHAQTAALNPHHLRRSRTFGKHYYDPGKYTETPSPPQPVAHIDETTAPWNQQAWWDELQVRIAGQVAFGQPLERSSRWNHWWNGHAYRRTIPSARRWWFDFRSDPAGIDGTHSWAGHEPHAVICHGAAMQRVPNGLRHLQHVCRQYDVPLFVMKDPRKWGGNTHDHMADLLQDLRHAVKQNIVTASLEYAAGRPFARGRQLGRVETEWRWQRKELVRVATEQVEKSRAMEEHQKAMDWSRLNRHDLPMSFSTTRLGGRS